MWRRVGGLGAGQAATAPRAGRAGAVVSAPVSVHRLLQPRIEAEVAFILEEDLRHPPFDRETVTEAVAYCAAALEIVDSRIADWKITLPCQKWGWQNFEDGSIRTENAQSTQTTLADKAIIDRFHLDFIEPKVLLESAEKRITFSWTNSDPWFDVTTWTHSETADFYCVEPWLGLPNAIHHGMGLRVLAAGEKETAICEIAVAKAYTDL